MSNKALPPGHCKVVMRRAQPLLSGDRQVDLRLLSPAEITRAKAFRSDVAYEEFVAAHILVRQVAADVRNVPVNHIAIVQRCEVCGGPHGRPFVEKDPSLHVSMSHGSGWVAAIAGPLRNAVDIERWDSFLEPSMINDKIFCAQELDVLAAMDGERGEAREPVEARAIAAAQMWARKESAIKLGVLTLDAMASFNSLQPLGDAASTAPSADALPLVFFDWVCDAEGFVGAVALSGPVQIEFDCGVARFGFSAGMGRI